MVQLRASLEALVLQAWRDRWSELEWSINLKQALASDDGELNKLCGLLLRQATLSEVPNKLMFTYLNFTVAAQVVSHSSLLEAIVEYRDFGREQCIEAILEQLNQSRDKLRCESQDAFQCERLCELLSRLMGWLMDGMEHSILVNDEQLLNELLITALPYLTSPFVALCMYFDALNHPDVCQLQIDRAAELCAKVVAYPSMPDIVKNEMIAFHRKLSSIPLFHSNAPISPLLDCREISPGNPHPAIITLSAVYGSFRVTKRHEEVAHMLQAAQSALGLPWWLVMSDLVRGALLIQLDPGAAARDSTITAFVYLKIPRILKEFIGAGVPYGELVRALEHVVAYHALLNSLDNKNKFNCYSNLLDQLKASGLINDEDYNHLLDMRNRERVGLIEAQPQNQQGIQLVLRAEGTVTTLERSFNNENALNPQKLVQMMSHMILSGGKSFDYICASSAATGKLARFAGKLALFNINSERL
uniref:Mediator of RNA polymerase II transcription subunit 24 n=1 Tax=Plectus sambesii TaxID=2011161 RepID=A0A914UUF0_9BILA